MRSVRLVIFAFGGLALIVMIGTLGQRTRDLLRMGSGLAQERSTIEELLLNPRFHDVANPDILEWSRG